MEGVKGKRKPLMEKAIDSAADLIMALYAYCLYVMMTSL